MEFFIIHLSDNTALNFFFSIFADFLIVFIPMFMILNFLSGLKNA